jgi:hypothetical protein
MNGYKAFPKPEMLERLAKALDIETHQLFAMPECKAKGKT